MSKSDGRRKEIAKRFQGHKTCELQKNGTSICVEGARYGFSANLLPISGTKPAISSLPISIGDARTPKQALKQARAFLRRTKRNQRR